MRINTFVFSLMFCVPVMAIAKGNSSPDPDQPRSGVERNAGILLAENKGQWELPVRYKAEIPGGAMFLTDKGFVYNYTSQDDMGRVQELKESGRPVGNEIIHLHAYKVNFLGANSHMNYLPTDKSSTYANYFLGNDRSKWAGNVGLYGKVVQQNVYDGIDLVVYGKASSVKYDFMVAPGADPAQIALSFEGVQPELTEAGDLHIKTSVNEIIEKAPYAYQLIDGKEVAVASAYKLSKGKLSFEFPEGYQRNLPLIIDPELVFCTYSGGVNGGGLGIGFYGFSTTYDNAGNAYAGSGVYNTGWPVTTGAFQANYSSLTNAQIVGINKYNATGTNLIYSTYYGGNSQDLPHAMRVNDLDELVIAGSTTSSTMPVTTGCYDSTLSGMDIFVAHFNSTGTALIGATYIGGNGTECNAFSLSGTDYVSNQNISSPVELNFDINGNIWVVGNSSSSDFPVTTNAQQSTIGGASDGVVFKLNPDCSSLLYSSFLGGSGNDAALGIQFTSAGNLAICGLTQSSNFPTTTGALHTTAPGGSFDGFVSIIDATTGAILQSTYVGTDNTDQAVQLQVDLNDNIYVLGRTLGDYPISPTAYSVTNGDVFIDKLSDDLSSSLLSTRLGKVQGTISQAYYPDGFLLDMCGNVYVTGLVPTSVWPISSISMPLSANAYQTTPANFWFGVLKPNFSDLLYGSYFGVEGDHSHCGVSRMDPNGIVYHSICNSLQYPFTTPNVFDSTYSGSGQDIVTFKFDFEATGVQSHILLPPTENDSVCAPYAMQFNNNSTSPYSIDYTWYFGDGTTSVAISPTHTFIDPGIYQVVLHAHSDSACIPDDYDTMTITVLQTELPDITVQDTIVCSPEQAIDLSVTINNPSPNNTVLWTPSTGIIAGANQPTVTVDPSLNTVYYVTVRDTIPGICGFSTRDTIHIDFAPRILNILTNDTAVCEGDQVQVVAESSPGFTFSWSPAAGMTDTTALNPLITVNQSETYTLTGHHEGCPDTSQTLSINMHYMPQVSLGPDIEVCQWQPVALQSNVTPFRNDYMYQWTPGEGLENPSGPDAEYIADTSGMYVLHVETPIGCAGQDSVYVTVFPGGFGGVSADTAYCPPASVPLIATGGLSYLWEPAYGLDDASSASPTASPATSTDYTVYITDQHGCVDTEMVSVAVYPLAVITIPDSITVYPGEAYHLEPGTNCLYFNWFPTNGINANDIADPEFSPAVRTRYFVTARTEHGCETNDSIDVLVKETILNMPNAFTPGHGENGIFKISKRGIAQLKSFSIYNRWGNKVFSTTNPDEGWDGTFNGQPQSMGTYIYHVEAVSNAGRPFTQQGNVTLIR